MKIFLYSILCIISLGSLENNKNMNFKKGLYYGRNKGFYPQNIVYVRIGKDTAIVECYLPLKGEYFFTFTDTLGVKNKGGNLWSSDGSVIFVRKDKMFFKTINGKSENNVRETQITYQPEKWNEYLDIKNRAKKFKE